MIIDGQGVVETDTDLVFALREPYWSAYKKYGWSNKEAGFGISIDLVREAVAKEKKIIAIYRGISYNISPITVNNFYKSSKIKPIFLARGKVKLVVVPQSKFTALPKRFSKEEYNKKEVERVRVNQDLLSD